MSSAQFLGYYMNNTYITLYTKTTLRLYTLICNNINKLFNKYTAYLNVWFIDWT